MEQNREPTYFRLKHCYKYISGMKFHVDDEQNLFVLDFSGTGCRLAETLKGDSWSWTDLFIEILSDIKNKICHVSRLDVACDLFEDERITVPFLTRYVMQNKFVCKSKNYLITAGTKESAVYFGSASSDRRLRIYDKALEQGIFDGVKWVRFEFQLRNDCALSFILNLSLLNFDWVSTYLGVMRDYLIFVTKPNVSGHTERLRITAFWSKFLKCADPLSQLYLPGQEYTLTTLHRFLYTTCASSIRLALELYAGDPTYLIEAGYAAQLNPKQQAVLDRVLLERQRLQERIDLVFAEK